MNTKTDSKNPNVLIIQCDCGHFYQELVNCARFTIIDEYSKITSELSDKENVQSENQFYVILIIQVPKIAGGCMSGFQTFKWFCYHIDDLQNNILNVNLNKYCRVLRSIAKSDAKLTTTPKHV